MDLLCRTCRRYPALLIALLASVIAVAVGALSSRHDAERPAAQEPFLIGSIPQPGEATSGVGDLAFGAVSVLDCPYSAWLGRGTLASRSGPLRMPLDWRLFQDQLASHEIEIRSDEDEMVNVELAAQAIDGIIVRPFETFSFNAAVGERSQERGFRPGLMFSRGNVITGLGGGVCIVSTVLYNAALKAGYKVIERGPHSGAVRYAEPGLDAAVVFGIMDMRFKNDTPSPIVIRASIQDDKLTVALFGRQRPGFEVELAKEDYKEIPYKVIETEDPTVPEGTVKVQVPARAGFDVTTVRILKQDGKIVRREVLSRDHVPPRDKVVLVPPRLPFEQPAPVDAGGSTEPDWSGPIDLFPQIGTRLAPLPGIPTPSAPEPTPQPHPRTPDGR